ncbi:DUF4880 domain-containing protein [Luteimonas sp. TWI1416]|uniref:DUF4880 domain-containing protein n=1 Tax=unclassified Luteimonas TaxID=2629088 RepID=UPI00320A83B3
MTIEDERIAQQAADFLVRSREETAEQRLEREAWLAQDPRHASAYLLLKRLDEQAARLLGDPDLQALKDRDSKLS